MRRYHKRNHKLRLFRFAESFVRGEPFGEANVTVEELVSFAEKTVGKNDLFPKWNTRFLNLVRELKHKGRELDYIRSVG